MRSNEGSSRGGARTDRRRRSLGSRPVRLGEASKQLEILLEDVDLDAEPELGRALADAVIAVDRAVDLAGECDGAEPSARDRLVDDVGGDAETTRREVERETGPLESGGLQFVGEAGAE